MNKSFSIKSLKISAVAFFVQLCFNPLAHAAAASSSAKKRKISQSESPFARAIKIGDEASVSELLMLSCVTDSLDEPIDEKGSTPLALAASRGDRAIVNMLLKSKGIQRAHEDRSVDYRPFLRALNQPGLSSTDIEKFCENTDLDSNAFNRQGLNPLMIAARQGDTRMIYLLQSRQDCFMDNDIDCINPRGETALMHAICSQKIESVKALLALNADYTILRDRRGKNAEDYAKRYPGMHQLISQKKEQDKVEFEALVHAHRDDFDAICSSTLLKTAIHKMPGYATYSLLSSGESAFERGNGQNGERDLPLSMSASAYYVDDIEIKSSLHMKSLLALSKHSAEDLAEALAYCADSGAKTPQLKLLLAHGVDVNIPFQGKTPLFRLIDSPKWNSNITFLRILLQAGADLTTKNPEGKTVEMVLEEREIGQRPDFLAAIRGFKRQQRIYLGRELNGVINEHKIITLDQADKSSIMAEFLGYS